jgi:calcium/calmodulin-dependent protein kinase I
MELMTGGDLMGKVAQIHHFSEDHAAHIVHQIILALNYMHGLKITHRDLKPENLMCTGEGEELTVKLTDFGFACTFDPKVKLDIILGTPIYMAPELVRG